MATHRPHLRIRLPTLRPQGLRQHVLLRMRPLLPLIDLSLPPQPPHLRVIMRHLRHPSLSRQIVNSTVPNVRKIHPPRHKPPQTQGRPHVPTLLITLPQLLQIRVNPVEQIRQNIPEPGRQSRCPLTEMLRHHPRDLLHRNLTRKLPRLLSAHPIAHRKKVIAILRSPLPDLPQISHLLRVNRQRQKRILIVLPHLPHMRLTRPLERQKRRPLTRRPTQNRWP